MKKKVYWALIAVFAVIFLVSGGIVVDYLVDAYEHEMNEQNYPSYPQATHPNFNTTAKPTTGVPGTTVPPTTGGNETTVPNTTVPNTTVPNTSVPPTTVPAGPQMLEHIKAFYDINPDVVGHISIAGTNVHYPVMQRPDIPDYYLYRAWDDLSNEGYAYKSDSEKGAYRPGSIYAEEFNDIFTPSDVVTLHGHHMKTGSMFAHVHRYRYEDHFNEHPYIQFDTLYEQHTYQVVCVFRTSGTWGVGFPFHLYNNFKDEAEYNEFINTVRDMAIHDSGIECNYGDKFLVLSTCEYTIENGRIVVVAKRII